MPRKHKYYDDPHNTDKSGRHEKYTAEAWNLIVMNLTFIRYIEISTTFAEA